MNPIIQIELLKLIGLCICCLGAGLFLGMLTICLMVASSRRDDEARGIGIKTPPTTPKPDVPIMPQASRPSSLLAFIDFRLGLAFVLNEDESLRRSHPATDSQTAIRNFNLVLGEAMNVLDADDERLREAMVEATAWLERRTDA